MFLIQAICFLFCTITAAPIDVSLIARQLQQDTAACFKQFSSLHEAETYKFWYSPYKNPYVNGSVQLTVKDSREILAIADSMITFFNEHNAPFYLLVNTHADIGLTSQKLSEKGFDGGSGYVMLHDLNNIPKTHIPGLVIKPIDTSDISTWLNIFNSSFGESDPAFTATYAQVMQHDITNNDLKYYAGYLDDTLVAVGKILIYPGYSYIHSIATDPAYRKRGIATHMVTTLLEIALNNGSEYTLLEAGSAVPVYEKIGFEKIMQIHGFEYTPPSMKKRRPAGRPFNLLIR